MCEVALDDMALGDDTGSDSKALFPTQAHSRSHKDFTSRDLYLQQKRAVAVAQRSLTELELATLEYAAFMAAAAATMPFAVTETKPVFLGSAASAGPPPTSIPKEKHVIIDVLNVLLQDKGSHGMTQADLARSITLNLFPIISELGSMRKFKMIFGVVKYVPFKHSGRSAMTSAGFIQFLYEVLDAASSSSPHLTYSRASLRFLMAEMPAPSDHKARDATVVKGRDDALAIKASTCFEDITIITRDLYKDMTGSKMRVNLTFTVYSDDVLRFRHTPTTSPMQHLCENKGGARFPIEIISKCSSGTSYFIPADSFVVPKAYTVLPFVGRAEAKSGGVSRLCGEPTLVLDGETLFTTQKYYMQIVVD